MERTKERMKKNEILERRKEEKAKNIRKEGRKRIKIKKKTNIRKSHPQENSGRNKK